MRIAVHTASTSVRLALESIIATAGYSLAASLAEADLIIRDQLHPTSAILPDHVATLTLTNSGAPGDDILLCPLRPYTLIQRLMVRTQTQNIALHEGWTLDLLARQLTHAENPAVTLTEKECALLKTLAGAPDALSREVLLATVWGMAGEIDTHTLETHIYRLRAKLNELTPSPGDIFTADGAYRWDTKS